MGQRAAGGDLPTLMHDVQVRDGCRSGGTLLALLAGLLAVLSAVRRNDHSRLL